MIINIAHTKGGVGKSTLATNLAVELTLPILDLDMQRSSFFFNEIRKDAGYPEMKVFYAQSDEEMAFLSDYKGNRKKHIIVDSGGMDNNLHRLAILYADIILTPIGLSQIELLGLQNFYSILEEANDNSILAKEYVILNQVNSRSKKEIDGIKELIKKEFGLKVLNSMISSRKIFKDAFSEGKSVVEKQSKSSSAEEINSLCEEIKKLLKKSN